jgi:hypothetical protein
MFVGGGPETQDRVRLTCRATLAEYPPSCVEKQIRVVSTLARC